MKPTCVGELHITGLSYKVVDPLSGLEVSGTQKLVIASALNKYKPDLRIDRRLQMNIIDKAPHMQVSKTIILSEKSINKLTNIKWVISIL